MSTMNFMEKLLDGVEVECKAMGDVCHVASGGTPSTVKKEYWDNGDIPWLKSESCNNESVYAADNFITELGLKNSSTKILGKDTTLIALVGATIFKTAYLEFEAATNQNIASIKSKDCKLLIDKFVFYYITNLYDELKTKMRNYGMLNLSTLRQFKIPIPCLENPERSLEIQAEIVRILDAFTKLTAELTAELTARKKQYNHYRDQLLSFEEGEVEWETLGELAENLDSKRKPITSGLRDAGDIPYYGASGIVDYVKDYIFDGDFLLVSEDGANLLARSTPIAFSVSGKSWVNNHAHVLKFETYAERRYVEYYLNSIDLTPYISGAAQPKLNQKNLNGIEIPNPSPEEKERIVAILDTFNALTNSISEGLPREIALRQKQYEYYRDLLLSFPKPEELAA